MDSIRMDIVRMNNVRLDILQYARDLGQNISSEGLEVRCKTNFSVREERKEVPKDDSPVFCTTDTR